MLQASEAAENCQGGIEGREEKRKKERGTSGAIPTSRQAHWELDGIPAFKEMTTDWSRLPGAALPCAVLPGRRCASLRCASRPALCASLRCAWLWNTQMGACTDTS